MCLTPLQLICRLHLSQFTWNLTSSTSHQLKISTEWKLTALKVSVITPEGPLSGLRSSAGPEILLGISEWALST